MASRTPTSDDALPIVALERQRRLSGEDCHRMIAASAGYSFAVAALLD